MILVKETQDNGIIVIDQKDDSFEEITEEVNSFGLKEQIKCNTCKSPIVNTRWHCIDCYHDNLIVDLCKTWYESHPEEHHLLVYNQVKDPNLSSKWEVRDMVRVIDSEMDQTYTCMSWGLCLTKVGFAVSFKTELEGLDKHKKTSIDSDFLFCLDHFDDQVCLKLETVYPNGHYSLMEWIHQYERKAWLDVLNNIGKKELQWVISYTKMLNSGNLMKCTIWNEDVIDKIWACMDDMCSKGITEESKEYQFIFICDRHVGLNQIWQTNDGGHKLVCIMKG